MLLAPIAGGPADPSTRWGRLALGGLLLTLFVIAVSTLQQAFDAGDRRRALAALASTRPQAGGPSLDLTLRERGGGQPPRCIAEVMSAFRGITRVTCEVAGDPVPYRFLWDDVRRLGLRPEDEATRRRLEGT